MSDDDRTGTLDLETLVPPGRRWVLVVLTLISAAGTLAAFPPLNLTGLAWVAPALLMLSLSQVPWRQGFLHGWLFGTVFTAGIVSFILPFGALPWVVLSVVIGLFYGLFGIAGSLLRTAHPVWRVPALAGAWFLMEFLRGHVGSLSLTFGHLAYSQVENLPLIQLASVFGAYGVSFVMALLSASISCFFLAILPLTWPRPPDLRLFNRQAGRVALLCFMFMIANYGWGRWLDVQSRSRLQDALAQESVQVAVVQAEGATHGARRGSSATLGEYRRLSLQQPADLVVWPETAIGGPLNLDEHSQREVGEVARRLNAHMLVGAGEEASGRTYNSAYFIQPNGQILGTYRKMDLVMFGEYVPGRDSFPFLQRYPIRGFDYAAGNERRVFTADGYDLAPLICFEGIFPDQTREVSRLGADVIAIITSDAWAPGKNEVRIHSAVGPLRAIEARKYVIRAASIGRSAIYDPYGNIVAQVPFWENGVATAPVAPVRALSIYHRWGDWPLLFASLALLILGVLRARRGHFIVQL